ncbi:MAG: hypothetical protein ACXVDD_24490, partial [Polyangia bacterium]
MRLAAVLAAALAAAGCVDTKACHEPTAWKPCAGEAAQPGASGTPPSIVALSLPTCAYKDAPLVSGTVQINDPDGDMQVLKATSFQGARTNESELQLDDARRSGSDWSGSFEMAVGSMSGTLMEGDISVVMKVSDRAGAQSVPYCNTITVVR